MKDTLVKKKTLKLPSIEVLRNAVAKKRASNVTVMSFSKAKTSSLKYSLRRLNDIRYAYEEKQKSSKSYISHDTFAKNANKKENKKSFTPPNENIIAMSEAKLEKEKTKTNLLAKFKSKTSYKSGTKSVVDKGFDLGKSLSNSITPKKARLKDKKPKTKVKFPLRIHVLANQHTI